jgi:hypothetical protein
VSRAEKSSLHLFGKELSAASLGNLPETNLKIG